MTNHWLLTTNKLIYTWPITETSDTLWPWFTDSSLNPSTDLGHDSQTHHWTLPQTLATIHRLISHHWTLPQTLAMIHRLITEPSHRPWPRFTLPQTLAMIHRLITEPFHRPWPWFTDSSLGSPKSGTKGDGSSFWPGWLSSPFSISEIRKCFFF